MLFIMNILIFLSATNFNSDIINCDTSNVKKAFLKEYMNNYDLTFEYISN